jgi:hypothetical protein
MLITARDASVRATLHAVAASKDRNYDHDYPL